MSNYGVDAYALPEAGTTAERPNGAYIGKRYFDTTTGQMLVWNGSAWQGSTSAGNVYYVDPANGSDDNDGRSPAKAFATLYKAHDAMTAGQNDLCILVGDGGTTGTARLSLALAETIDESATVGTLVWSKNACHLIGLTAPSYNQRARIAPPSGTYTQATFASGEFVKVTASGCIFSNFSVFNGFSTGGADQVCWRDTGSRNFYSGVHFGGMGDQASADDAGSRSLLLEGAESVFVNCVIGLDTVTRGAANASVEFKTTNCKRHTFRDCFFPFMADAASPLGIKVATAGHSDRWQRFINCVFLNCVGSTSTTLTALATLAASIGGVILLENPVRVGITDWGTDSTSLGQIYVAGAAVGATDDVGRAAVAVAS